MAGSSVAKKKQFLVDLKNQLKEAGCTNLIPQEFMDSIKDFANAAPSKD